MEKEALVLIVCIITSFDFTIEQATKRRVSDEVWCVNKDRVSTTTLSGQDRGQQGYQSGSSSASYNDRKFNA